MLNEIAFISLGAIIGTVWWLFFIFIVFLPQMRALRAEINSEKDRIEQKVDNNIAKVDSYLEKIPDFNEPADLVTPILKELSKPIPEWKPEYRNALGNVFHGATIYMVNSMGRDENGKPINPELNKAINDKLNALATNMKKETMAELEELPGKVAKKYGYDLEGLTNPLEALDDLGDMGKTIKALIPLAKMFGVMPQLPGQGQLPAYEPYSSY